MQILKTGDIAPSFSLYNTEKKEIHLDNFKGSNTVILFYPMAFSSTCTKELCTIQDEAAFYKELNASVIGISVDSLFTLKKYKETYNLGFELLSDFNKETSRAYGSLDEDWAFNMKGVSKRSVFVIDGQGYISYIEIMDSPGNMPNLDAIKTALQQLQ